MNKEEFIKTNEEILLKCREKRTKLWRHFNNLGRILKQNNELKEEFKETIIFCKFNISYEIDRLNEKIDRLKKWLEENKDERKEEN